MVELTLFGYDLEIQNAFFLFYIVFIGLLFFNPLMEDFSLFQRISFAIIIIPLLIIILNYQANK